MSNAVYDYDVPCDGWKVNPQTTYTEGPEGHPGAVGPMGPQGVQGPKGDTGDRGEQGIQGIQGNVGPGGPIGLQGVQGIQGPIGLQGIQGIQGIQGEIGPAGESAYQAAVLGGYSGTKPEFDAMIADFNNNIEGTIRGLIGIANGVAGLDASGHVDSQMSYTRLIDVPTTFTPKLHGHTPAEVGLPNVNNTSDEEKPISIDAQAALDLKADLVGGLIPSSQLPSYVDDVLEVSTYANLPVTGETGKIYIVIGTNKTYRWSGTVYAEVGSSIAIGETSATAYRGDRGKTAYDHSQDATIHVTSADKTNYADKYTQTQTDTLFQKKIVILDTAPTAYVGDNVIAFVRSGS